MEEIEAKAKLEEYISIYEQLKCSIQPSEVKAIETLLNLLEKKNRTIQQLKDENKELEKDNKRYEKELHDVIEFSISISLVEEKIEELKENGYWKYLEERDLETTIDILQELLEKR